MQSGNGYFGVCTVGTYNFNIQNYLIRYFFFFFVFWNIFLDAFKQVKP